MAVVKYITIISSREEGNGPIKFRKNIMISNMR